MGRFTDNTFKMKCFIKYCVVTALSFNIVVTQEFRKITFVDLDVSEDNSYCERMYRFFGIQGYDLNEFYRISYRMIDKDNPGDGDEIVYYPKDENYSPRTVKLTSKTILGTRSANRLMAQGFRDSEINKIINEKGKTFLIAKNSILNGKTLEMFYNPTDNTVFKMELDEDLGDKLLDNVEMVQLKLNYTEKKIAEKGLNDPVYTLKNYYNFDTLLYTSPHTNYEKVSVEDKPSFININDFLSSSVKKKIFKENTSYIRLSSGEKVNVPVYLDNSNDVEKFLMGSSDSLAVKEITHPKTGKPLFKVVGNYKDFGQNEFTYTEEPLTERKVESEEGIEGTVYVPKSFNGELKIVDSDKSSEGIGKVPPILLAALGTSLLMFFTVQ